MTINQLKVEGKELIQFINIDAIGHFVIPDTISFYNWQDEEKSSCMKKIANECIIEEGDQWFQGEHVIFMNQGVKCITFSVGKSLDIHHTPQDVFELLDFNHIKKIAILVKTIIERIFDD